MALMTNQPLRMPNAPKWARYVVIFSAERARYTGLPKETRYFKDLAKAEAHAYRTNEDVYPIRA